MLIIFIQFFRLSETFDRLEFKSQLEDEMLGEFSGDVDDTERAHTSNQSIRQATARSQQNKSELGGQYHIG